MHHDVKAIRKSLLKPHRPLPQNTPRKSPTSSPLVLQPDPTITSTLPLLTTIRDIAGTNNSASFLLHQFAKYLGLQGNIRTNDEVDESYKIMLEKTKDMINL